MGKVKVLISKELVESFVRQGQAIGPAECTAGLSGEYSFSGSGVDKFGDLLIVFEGEGLPYCGPGEKPELFTPVYTKTGDKP